LTQALENILSLWVWNLTATRITEHIKHEFRYFKRTTTTTKCYPLLRIFRFISLQRNVKQNNLRAELIGKYRIFWLRWSQLVSQIVLC
jgi:hypothetical protein